jgi:VanZ family protein
MMMTAKRGIIKPSFFSYGLTLLALAIITFLLLIPLPNSGEEDVFQKDLWNLLHVPLFAVIMILVRFLQTSCPVRWSSLWLCALVVFLIGALFEVIQNFIGRSCSIDDLLSNLGGILLACALLLKKSQRHHLKMRFGSLLVGLGILVSGLHPLVNEVLAARAKRANFPEILDLKYPEGLWHAQGNTRMRVVKVGDVGSVKGLEVFAAVGSY